MGGFLSVCPEAQTLVQAAAPGSARAEHTCCIAARPKVPHGGNVRAAARLTPYPSFQIRNQITDQHHNLQEMNTQLSVGVAQRLSSPF